MNKNVTSVTRFVAAGLAAVALAACEAKKSSNPLSPSVAGPIAGVEITAPKLLEPAQGFKFKEKQQPIRLVIENSITNGVRTVSYLFEVASDSEFKTKVFARSGVAAGEGGRTSVQIDALELGRGYYWRARAEDGANSSTYSTAQFELLPRAQLSVPGVVSPINDERVTTRRPTLRVNPSDRNSAIGTVSYFFMVAKDPAFTQISATGLVEEQTSWTVDRELDPNIRHYWRVHATDGETSTAVVADAPVPDARREWRRRRGWWGRRWWRRWQQRLQRRRTRPGSCRRSVAASEHVPCRAVGCQQLSGRAGQLLPVARRHLGIHGPSGR